ncbi:hypothetical protein FHN55_16990 [Streptomyces sp. NP160]|uniref:hypothetical protein n=1 Tax=Streptomyces sp. NP160 TaxID=2586637 RepID=UPI001119EA27|nr:hypothetical protein [Streptomyces sp. NP160]TNM61526.1 hypothetical protein FHN55_16990 [Streptomyces sp. NP160]
MNKEELALAALIGTKRTEENKNGHHIAEYRQQAFNLSTEQANRLGVLAEMAVLKWLGAPYNDRDVWIDFVPRSEYSKLKGRPDIQWQGMDIEVRRANKEVSPIPLRKKDQGYIVVQPFIPYEQHSETGLIRVGREVQLLGWARWDDETTKPWWSNGSSMVALEKRPMNSFFVGEAA